MRLFSALALITLLAIVSISPFFKWTTDTYPQQGMPDVQREGGGTTTSTASQVTSAWQEAFDYAQAYLPKTGELVVKSDGFGYIRVDNAYIDTLFPMLDVRQDGFRKPPYFRRPEAPGAHISVFYENEHVRPAEVGEYFNFELKRIKIVNASKDTSYVILEVDAPELEVLREKYGLSPKLFGHEFHITLAKRTLHPRSRW